jgi:type IV pilus assembly protein PilB
MRREARARAPAAHGIAATHTHRRLLELVDLDDLEVDPEAVKLLPEALARRFDALPVGFGDGALRLALSDPTNIRAIDDAQLALGVAFFRAAADSRPR